MEFEKQITDVELVIDTTPRVYIKWNNTEEGRDKKDCYERVVTGRGVIYINTYNRKLSVICGHPFWDKLEKMYNSAIESATPVVQQNEQTQEVYALQCLECGEKFKEEIDAQGHRCVLGINRADAPD